MASMMRPRTVPCFLTFAFSSAMAVLTVAVNRSKNKNALKICFILVIIC